MHHFTPTVDEIEWATRTRYKTLCQRIKDAESFEAKHPQFQTGWHAEYLEWLKARRAERIALRKGRGEV